VLGCAGVGKTIEETLANMKGALELHFEGMVEDGDPIPRPGGAKSYRQVMKDPPVEDYVLAHVEIDISRLSAPAKNRVG
jgi:predicted RNase H-like HicB family nuclease